MSTPEPSLQSRRNGFDVILGNPPWERVKLQDQEFFAQRDPAVAGAPAAEVPHLQAVPRPPAIGLRRLVLLARFCDSRRMDRFARAGWLRRVVVVLSHGEPRR